MVEKADTTSGKDLELTPWVRQSAKELAATVYDVPAGSHPETIQYWIEDLMKAVISQVRKP